jgi:hypothetical protein
MKVLDFIFINCIYAPTALCIIADIINSATKYRNNRLDSGSRPG